MDSNVLSTLIKFIVGAAFTIAVIIGWPYLTTGSQISQLQANNSAIYSCVKSAYQAQVNFTANGYGVAVISAANLAAAGCTVTSTNALGGATTVTGNTTSFYVDQDLIPQSVCTQTMTQTAPSSGITNIGAAAAGTTPGSVSAVPATLATAATACAVASNKMRFQMQ